jgi:transcriptional regulator with XRE-family HTH domain
MSLELTAMMQDAEIRIAFAARIKELRKQKGWTQKELANKVGSNYQSINKYEGGLHTPPLDKLVLLAEVLGTTIDYLVVGDLARDVPLYNTQLLDRFKALESFCADDQQTVIKVIDAMIVKQRVESAMQPVGQSARRAVKAE